MKSSSLPLHAPRPRQLALALVLALPMLAHAGVEIDQVPLTVGKPLEPNIWFILDDSGSMGRDYMPDNAPSGNISRRFHLRNTIFYNPAVTYTPWMNADGTPMDDANYSSVSTSENNLTGSTDLSDNAQCFHTLRTPTSNPAYNSQLYRWRLNTNGSARRCDANATCTDNTGCVNVTSFTWTLDDGTTTTRTIAQERQNYANWYHYYRTRMKMAKASVSRAFSTLEDEFRVGYTSIWNRNRFDIPVQTDNGLFRGSNRESWYESLLSASSSSNTPLRRALDQAGQYFMRADANGPYGPESGTDQLSCRQNFTILTTDGYWNDAAASTAGARANVDNTDGSLITHADGETTYQYTASSPYRDGWSNTLADVAMYYWNRDLREDLANDVPTAAGTNPAFWQHMRVFGISIGLQGTLDPETVLEGTFNWPDPTDTENLERIDDLFHATVNARGQFLVASNPEQFTKSLSDALGAIASETGRSASGAASSTSVDIGTMTYFTQYTSGTWSGDVRGYEIDPSTGRVSTAPGSGWAASEVLPAWGARKIFFNKGGALTAFTWGNLSSTQRTALGSETIVNYLRGDDSNEITDDVPPGGTLRPRDNPLGSFVNSQPVYVGKPPFSHYYENASTPGADSYKDHATSKASRTPVLYVGGNDGMLHGFNAVTGVETFAFVPSSVINETLREYSNPEYEHHYFVDGELTVAEAYVDGAWRTILVGSLGRGGRGVFALDVTNPDSISLLWEKSASDIPALGNVIGKPIIAEVGPASDWRAVFGNGPNGSGDKAQLISISLNDGSVSVIDTGEGGDNGLSAPLVWDADKNGTFETVYAGDLKGNVWRFNNIYEASPPTPFHLFTTDGNRPITASPWAAVNQRDLRTWVFVGTGQYLNETDRASTATQTWYGLIDENETIGGRATELVERSITATGTVGGRRMRTVESGSASQMVGKKGWYIDFTETGERMITPNMFYGSALIGTTFIPDGSDLCKPGGRSALWGIDPFTGASLRKKLFNNYGTLGGEFPGVLDDLKPILVGNPPVTISEEGERTVVVIHTDPEEEEEFTPPTGDAEGQSWREVVGQ
ncbi:pilus assembly protein [Thauera propionica]|uniref:pilus assembly protein n=1 Tax=Thauera propionica TaxID=2019431 RepID=UPI0023F2BC7B|nr:PilC/PilY family type IV pilus protein [Thauera propionica]MDD3673943.1 PilC/PilY family type IV pilus protein [Thauera propionica]